MSRSRSPDESGRGDSTVLRSTACSRPQDRFVSSVMMADAARRLSVASTNLCWASEIRGWSLFHLASTTAGKTLATTRPQLSACPASSTNTRRRIDGSCRGILRPRVRPSLIGGRDATSRVIWKSAHEHRLALVRCASRLGDYYLHEQDRPALRLFAIACALRPRCDSVRNDRCAQRGHPRNGIRIAKNRNRHPCGQLAR